MKRKVKITESQLNNVILKIINEGELSKSQNLMNFLITKGFKKVESSSSVDFTFGNDNEGLFVIYYKDENNLPYYVFRLTGGQTIGSYDSPKKMNSKKVFDKQYSSNQIEELKRDIDSEIKKVKITPRA